MDLDFLWCLSDPVCLLILKRFISVKIHFCGISWTCLGKTMNRVIYFCYRKITFKILFDVVKLDLLKRFFLCTAALVWDKNNLACVTKEDILSNMLSPSALIAYYGCLEVAVNTTLTYSIITFKFDTACKQLPDYKAIHSSIMFLVTWWM